MGESGPVIITRFFTKCAIISQPLAPYLYEFFGMVYDRALSLCRISWP